MKFVENVYKFSHVISSVYGEGSGFEMPNTETY